MPTTDYTHRRVTEDGRTLIIEFLDGKRLELSREEAYALLEIIEEQLPRMATKGP